MLIFKGYKGSGETTIYFEKYCNFPYTLIYCKGIYKNYNTCK